MTAPTQPAAQPAPAPDALFGDPAVPTAAEVAGALEALLLLADEPMHELTLAQAVGAPEAVTLEALEALATFYDETGRGFELRRVGGGWRYWTRAEHADVIAAYVVAGQSGRLSQAALETLAVIAYQQPVSRGRVAAIRGVNVDGVIRTLVARGLVEEAGHDAETGAAVFATTREFLEKLGLVTLDDLPPLAAPVAEVVPPTPLPAEQDETARVPAEQDETARVPAGQDETARVPAGQDETARVPAGQDEEVGA